EAKGCKGRRRSGNEWIYQCPAHDDRKPSLSVREGADGKVLVCCHARCGFADIVQALGLRERDAFPTTKGKGRLLSRTVRRLRFQREIRKGPPPANSLVEQGILHRWAKGHGRQLTQARRAALAKDLGLPPSAFDVQAAGIPAVGF